MRIPFAKVQGAGNDFVLVDGRQQRADWQALAPALCDRHFGIGADGLLVVADSRRAPIAMQIYNPDGSPAEMCGNGLRCFVKYAVERGGVPAPNGALDVETGAGILSASFAAGQDGVIERVRTSMGVPRFAPAEVPVEADGAGPITDLSLGLDGHEPVLLTCLSLGNPHAVHFTEQPVADFPLERIGPQIEHHPRFPNRTNFEIVNVLAPDHLRVRVWERGAGLTLACGTGACAALVAARLHGLAEPHATLSLPGGDLLTEWEGSGPVFLEGPAAYVFEGEWITHGSA